MYIIGCRESIDGEETVHLPVSLKEKITKHRLKIHQLSIAPSDMKWSDELPAGYFHTGCSAIQALCEAKKIFSENRADIVIISGEDYLKSKYKNRTQQRNKNFEVYGVGKSPLTEYNHVVTHFLDHWKMSTKEFKDLSLQLFENYVKTWKQKNPNSSLPNAKWFEYITPFFRGVDCANPSIDYSGDILLCAENIFSDPEAIKVSGVGFEQGRTDGTDSIHQIVSYSHLADAFQHSCSEAGIDFKSLFLQQKAYLEVYTCFPVVPLAFLLSTDFCSTLDSLSSFIKSFDLTVTGGLNLARAPWNCTTLKNLISMSCKLRKRDSLEYGGVHGNGSLGHLQGFVILEQKKNH